MSRLPIPDFFIVGAPKCGTTALYSYLSTHPAIFMPQLKEPHFFCRDFPSFGKIRDLDSYVGLFEKAQPGLMTGEASVWYLFSEIAVPRILEFRPDAKIIVMLRNPVKMVRSLHNQLLVGFREDIDDLEEAWRAQPDRAAGKRLPHYCPEARHLQYREVCNFHPQIQNLFERVPLPQRKIIIFEEFFRDPAQGYHDVLEFLGLPYDGRDEFPVVNEATTALIKALQRFIRDPPYPLSYLHQPLQHLVRSLGLRPIKMLRAINSRPLPNVPLRPEFEQELYDTFEKGVDALSDLLGNPLHSWRRR